MKKIIFAFALLASFITSAKTTDFTFSEAAVKADFASINKLEQVVEANPTMAAEDILTQNTDIDTANLDLTSTLEVANKDLPLVSPFWWGCCLGVIGLLVVYIITDNDKPQVKSAFWGCLISSIIFGLGGIFDVFNLF